MPFTKLGLPAPLIRSVRLAGYTEPTPIQQQAIPIVLAGHDLVGAAQTGTGKTAAFLLPILTRLMTRPHGLRALVLVPTRELAAQVESNARDYAHFTEVRSATVYGGVPIGPQERMFRRDEVDLLVATPGRLLDLHGRMALRLEDIEVLVLDEADRMVDMGFAPDLRRILALLPRRRQTLMFSATMPPDLNRVASEALRNPRRIDLAPPSRPAAGITQAVYLVPRHLKTDLLDHVLSKSHMTSVLVFARTKRGADRLSQQLARRGHSVAVIHGDRSQSQRDRALGDLKRGRVQILVATDIAARGIDVDDISHVVNYDVPRAPEDYVHRIGRTGRVEATGDAYTFVSPEERDDLTAIERFLGHAIPRVLVPDFDYHRASTAESRRPLVREDGRARRPRPARDPRGPARVRVVAAGASRDSHAAAGRSGIHGVAEPSVPHGRRPQRNLPDRRRRRM